MRWEVKVGFEIRNLMRSFDQSRSSFFCLYILKIPMLCRFGNEGSFQGIQWAASRALNDGF